MSIASERASSFRKFGHNWCILTGAVSETCRSSLQSSVCLFDIHPASSVKIPGTLMVLLVHKTPSVNNAEESLTHYGLKTCYVRSWAQLFV